MQSLKPGTGWLPVRDARGNAHAPRRACPDGLHPVENWSSIYAPKPPERRTIYQWLAISSIVLLPLTEWKERSRIPSEGGMVKTSTAWEKFLNTSPPLGRMARRERNDGNGSNDFDA